MGRGSVWLIEIAAYIVRIPFLILRKAGLPASVEDNIVSQVAKVILTVALLLLVAYLGLEKYLGDVPKAFGRQPMAEVTLVPPLGKCQPSCFRL